MNLELQGLCYLAAWDRRLAFDAGMNEELRLRSCNLDYSWNSLDRIDTFLDTLREARHPSPEAFLAEPRNQNLLYFLAFYVGEVRARSVGVRPRWASWDELLEAAPGMQVLGEGFHSSLVQTEPGLYLPLVAISARLFEGPDEKSVAFSAAMELDIPDGLSAIPGNVPLPPIPGQSLMPSYPAKFAELAHPRRQAYLNLEWPDWSPDIVERMRAALPVLLKEGRMVWAATILANGALYEGSATAAPAEIVYDPRGMVDVDVVNGAAGMLLSLRGNQHASPELQKYAEHFNDMSQPLMDWQTPPDMMPYPLSTCVLVIDAAALPGQRLVMKNFPVLVSDRHPGVATVAPQELWPAALLLEWLRELPPDVRTTAALRLQSTLPAPPAVQAADRLLAVPLQGRAAKRARNQRWALIFKIVFALALALGAMWQTGYLKEVLGISPWKQ